jgi:hypothetical protein
MNTMTSDMSSTIIAKSDQINASDLLGNPRTVTVKEVRIKAGDDQPVTILIEGDAKAFRPCKGVRRLLVRVWGPDASKYIGQSMTLFCDPKVTWAGKEEGGIRVSHMTGIDEEIVEYMRFSRAATKPYKIYPLQQERQYPDVPRHTRHTRQTPEEWTAEHIAAVDACATMDELDRVIAKGKGAVGKMNADEAMYGLRDRVMQSYTDMTAALTREGQPGADMGEGFGE